MNVYMNATKRLENLNFLLVHHFFSVEFVCYTNENLTFWPTSFIASAVFKSLVHI